MHYIYSLLKAYNSFRSYSVIFSLINVNGSLSQWVEFGNRFSQINQSDPWTNHSDWFSELDQLIHWKKSDGMIHSQVDSVIIELCLLSVNIEIKFNLLHTQRNHMASDLIQWYSPWPIWQIIEWSLNLGISSVRSISCLIYEQIIQIGFLNWINGLIKNKIEVISTLYSYILINLNLKYLSKMIIQSLIYLKMIM